MRIGELASRGGITTETARFYEKRGLLPAPQRTPAGYRDYLPDAVDRVRFIRTAQTVGFTLAEIGEILELRDQGVTPCRHVQALIRRHSQELEDRIRELQAMHDELAVLATIEPGPDGEDVHCRIIEHRTAELPDPVMPAQSPRAGAHPDTSAT